MAREVHDFEVGIQGHCFICLKQSQFSQMEEQFGDDPHPVYSLQCLSRYLNLDMRKVFIADGGPIPSGLLAKVTASKLKAELCEPCALVNDKFSELFRQFEKATMGLTSTLKTIFAKLEKAEADEATAGCGRFAKMGSFGSGKLEIVKALRKETMQKCSKELDVSFPRVRLQNLSMEQVNKGKLKIKNDFHMERSQWLASNGREAGTSPESLYDSDNFADPAIDVGDVKLETYADGSTPDYDNGFCNAEYSDSDSSKTLFLKSSNKGSLASFRNKCISNSKTGKHKCRECSKECSSITAFYQHYRSQHLKFRYVCSVCGRQFTQVGNFNRHQRLNHKDARFKCRVCNQVFSLESNLLKHRRTNSCSNKETVEKSGLVIVRPLKVRPKFGTLQKMCRADSKTGKLKCKLCPREFQIMSAFRIHYNSIHLKVRYNCTLCQKEFSTRKSYAGHHERYHMNEKFNCTKCDKTFKTKHNLRGHLRKIPDCSKLPKYSCNVCNNTFLSKNKLSLHQRTSSGCKVKVRKPKIPIKCPETLVIIPPKNTPKEGGRLYKVDPKSGKYMCNICSKEFASSGSFRVHHKGVHLKIRYQCTLCRKEFSFRSTYDTHHRDNHMGDKRLKCEKCHKMLKGRSSLWQHRQRHCRERDS